MGKFSQDVWQALKAAAALIQGASVLFVHPSLFYIHLLKCVHRNVPIPKMVADLTKLPSKHG